MTVETIPLPEDRIAREEPFEVRVSNLHAWPGQELVVEFEMNPMTEHWIWELNHSRVGRLWPRGRAVLGKAYTYWPYFMCRFIDTTDKHDRVHTDNLGGDVVLACFPGPLGGSFHPESDISQAEEDRFLGRGRWRQTLGARG